MTVVLDTNILISALIHSGSARFLIYRLVETNINIAISDYIIKEAEAVLKRSKFRRRQIFPQIWKELKPIMVVVSSKNGQLSKLLRDPKDHPILITAQNAKADYLITGDDDLLTLKKWRGAKIISIRQCQKLLTALSPAN